MSETWAIRVTYENGRDAWLRHGATTGEGPIVRFRTRAAAEKESVVVREGFDDNDGATISIVCLNGHRRLPASVAAIDPQAGHPGKLSPRDPKSSSSSDA